MAAHRPGAPGLEQTQELPARMQPLSPRTGRVGALPHLLMRLDALLLEHFLRQHWLSQNWLQPQRH